MKTIIGLTLMLSSTIFLANFFWLMYDHFGRDIVVALALLSGGVALFGLGRFLLLVENK